MEPFQQMVSRYSASYSRSDRDWSFRGNSKARKFSGQEPATGTISVTGQCLIENGFNQNNGGHKDVERAARVSEEPKLPQALDFGRESGGAMLDISGLQRFYYIRDFHDMRCKYDRVMSVIREQFHREPQKDEFFIIMSKDRRKVRLFNYDRRSASLFEKRFSANYRFMKPLANERKNSYFYGSDKMANVSAVYHTLISTCKLMKVSVTEYFSKVFAKIVRGCTDYASLLPMNMDLRVNIH